MYKIVRLFFAVFAACYAATSFGLADASAPTKIQIPFANGAGGAYVRTIPVASQIGIQNGAASYTDGFPPLNFTPVSAGGVPPFGQDMNGILRDVSSHARWWAAGGPVYYDGTYQTAIGGYPKGAVIQSTATTGRLWVSTVDNNTSNPDTGGANWQYVNDAVNVTGTVGSSVTGTTPALGDNSTKISTTAFVQTNVVGNSESWQNFTGSRSIGVAYQFFTGRPIQVAVSVVLPASTTSTLIVGGVVVSTLVNNSTASLTMSHATAIVPSGVIYSVTGGVIQSWAELR